MKKIASLIMSMVILTFARSTHAQGLLNFNPSRPKPAPQPIATPTETPTKPTRAAIDFDTSAPQPPVIDTSQDDDRLVAVAPDELFEGGSNSLVAKAVGSAEGTRTPDGGKTWAYYGHVDPGNGVWNQGSFSYQHGANSPDEADQRQLARLRRQYDVIQETAISAGLRLGLEEQLNGIDLANQAPLAALERGGYVDRLRQAYAQGLRGSEAVLQARTYSYINPQTNQWDAPGLGNNLTSISRDQARRQGAISEAIGLHRQSQTARRNSEDVKVSTMP